MSLDKAIKYGKEKRKIYRGSKAFDCSCRNHGTCNWCLSNRTHKNNKKIVAAEDILRTAHQHILKEVA